MADLPIEDIIELEQLLAAYSVAMTKGDVEAVGEEVNFSLNIAPECGGNKDKDKKE